MIVRLFGSIIFVFTCNYFVESSSIRKDGDLSKLQRIQEFSSELHNVDWALRLGASRQDEDHEVCYDEGCLDTGNKTKIAETKMAT
jgi:hypothetical protein